MYLCYHLLVDYLRFYHLYLIIYILMARARGIRLQGGFCPAQSWGMVGLVSYGHPPPFSFALPNNQRYDTVFPFQLPLHPTISPYSLSLSLSLHFHFHFSPSTIHTFSLIAILKSLINDSGVIISTDLVSLTQQTNRKKEMGPSLIHR